MTDQPQTPRLFTTAETARLSGNKPSRIEAWTRLGILIPAQIATRGGTRLYPLLSVIEAGRCGLLADRGLSSAQLQQTVTLLRTRIADTVRAEPGFDLEARAAYGFLIETVKGIVAMYGLTGDPVIKGFLQKAEARQRNKNFWRLDHLDSDDKVAALVAGLALRRDGAPGEAVEG